MSKPDYYELLGIPRDASENQIKKAYKKLALKWHPDKNPDKREEAELKFKELGEAYSVLTDPKKRRIYDKYGHEGLESGGSGPSSGFEFHHFDFKEAEDIFKAFFGGRDPFSMFMDDDDDFFGGSLFGRRGRNGRSNRRDPFESMFGGRDPFEDMFSGMGGFSFSSSSSTSGGRGGTSKSVKTVVESRNGRQVKKTVTTIKKPEGTVETYEDVQEGDAPKKHLRY